MGTYTPVDPDFEQRVRSSFAQQSAMTLLGGYAAYTLMPAGAEVLSVEFKVNLLRPAAGERFVARATVLKPGRTLTVARADVLAFGKAGSTLVAAMRTLG